MDIMMPFAQFTQNSIHLFSFTKVVPCIESFIPKTYLTVVVATSGEQCLNIDKSRMEHVKERSCAYQEPVV